VHFDGRILPLILQEFPFVCGIYPLEDIQKLKILLERIHTICSKKMVGNEFLINSLLQEFLSKLGQLIFLYPHIPKKENRLEELLQQIEISPEKELSNKALAESFGISEFHFIRIFKAKTGLSPVQYQISAKLKKAAGLLLDTQLNVSEIGYMCGFSDPLYFSTLFKKKMGQSPTLYRKSHY
jgi:AraC-like DNA-binding protein